MAELNVEPKKSSPWLWIIIAIVVILIILFFVFRNNGNNTNNMNNGRDTTTSQNVPAPNQRLIENSSQTRLIATNNEVWQENG